MANGQIQSAYVWFNGFMGLVLGVLGGTFALGVFTKCATARGAFVSLIASAIVIVAVKYGMSNVSIWSYSLISLIVSMVAGIIASKIDRRIHKDLPMPLPDTTIYKK